MPFLKSVGMYLLSPLAAGELGQCCRNTKAPVWVCELPAGNSLPGPGALPSPAPCQSQAIVALGQQRHPLLPVGWEGLSRGTSKGEMLLCFLRAALPPSRDAQKKVFFLIKTLPSPGPRGVGGGLFRLEKTSKITH